MGKNVLIQPDDQEKFSSKVTENLKMEMIEKNKNGFLSGFGGTTCHSNFQLSLNEKVLKQL